MYYEYINRLQRGTTAGLIYCVYCHPPCMRVFSAFRQPIIHSTYPINAGPSMGLQLSLNFVNVPAAGARPGNLAGTKSVVFGGWWWLNLPLGGLRLPSPLSSPLASGGSKRYQGGGTAPRHGSAPHTAPNEIFVVMKNLVIIHVGFMSKIA